MTDRQARPIAEAPTDGTMIWLLVDYREGDHPLEDEAEAWTLGFKTEPEWDWQFVGWNWEQDHFCEGRGHVIGWLPCDMPGVPAHKGPVQ